MSYRELIKKVQHDSGFSDAESEEALDRMVESIAERLEDNERKNFASQLPPELQDIALRVAEQPRHERKQGIIEEFMQKESIDHDRAKKQVLTAWKALKSFISSGEIDHVKSQLPARAASILY